MTNLNPEYFYAIIGDRNYTFRMVDDEGYYMYPSYVNEILNWIKVSDNSRYPRIYHKQSLLDSGFIPITYEEMDKLRLLQELSR